jgi:anhydro-N-acetylmuramic acid kinase
LNDLKIEVFIPDENTIQYKEAIAMALIGVLRWREAAYLRIQCGEGCHV